MIETLVLYTCLSALAGCKQATTAYYEATPAIKESLELNEIRARNIVPVFMQETLPVLMLAAQGRATIKNVTLDVNNKSVSYVLPW